MDTSSEKSSTHQNDLAQARAEDSDQAELIQKRKIDGAMLARRIDDAPTLPQKAELLWALPALERHAALGSLDAATVAALVETDPESNTALLGNLPHSKFHQIINLGTPDQGRRWLERAMASKLMGATMLPALLPARDLMLMLMSSKEFSNSLSLLLNYRRAEQMRTLLHPLEWKNSLDDLLLADAEELLKKSPIKDRNVKAILQSLIDFFPELYLDVIRQSLDYRKYQEDRGEELNDILEMPFAMPEFLNEQAEAVISGSAPTADVANNNAERPASNALMPMGTDDFMQMATSSLPVDRRDQLEAELKDLLRREILDGGGFSQSDMQRASGRLLFQIRAGLIQLNADTPQGAAQVLLTQSFAQVVALGVRLVERYRQRALQLAGTKDWLDRSQRAFLTALQTLEPGIDPDTGLPAIFLPSRIGQPREDWLPTPLRELEEKFDQIIVWASLAKAAFGSPARVQSIFASMKTKTVSEVLRRTVIALCLYRRWEPELVNPAEDLPLFRKRFADDLGRLPQARDVVKTALDETPAGSWKPHDAKQRTSDLFMSVIDELQSTFSRANRQERKKPKEAEDEDD